MPSTFRSGPAKRLISTRTDIMNFRGPFSKLRDPIARHGFDFDLQRMLYRLPFRIITVVIDKRAHTDHYVSAKEAYHYCAEVLLERYCLYVQSQNAVGDVVVEARGKAEDRQLSKVWAEFYEKGTDFAPPELIRRVLTSTSPSSTRRKIWSVDCRLPTCSPIPARITF